MTNTRPSFRNLQTPADVASYTEGLAERWPARQAVMDHLVRQLAFLPRSTPLHVLELCCGAGVLAQRLLHELPALCYTGIDSSPPMLAFARDQLLSYGARAVVLDADLNGDGWLATLESYGIQGKFHAILSMQSLHDLGGEPEVNRIYERAKELLTPGGLLLNADLIVSPGEELPDNPGRLSITRHLDLLQRHGYRAVSCSLAKGGFGCVSGYHFAG